MCNFINIRLFHFFSCEIRLKNRHYIKQIQIFFSEIYDLQSKCTTFSPLSITSPTSAGPWQEAGPRRQGAGPSAGRHRHRGRTNEVGLWGRRDKEGGRAIGKEARPRSEAGCRKQGQGGRTQDQLQTQPGPMDPRRQEGTKREAALIMCDVEMKICP